jgi:hypothetical protein
MVGEMTMVINTMGMTGMTIMVPIAFPGTGWRC